MDELGHWTRRSLHLCRLVPQRNHSPINLVILRHQLIREYLPGSSAAERAASLANIETEDLAEMLDILNQKLQGSSETLLSATTKSVGGHKMVAVEHRYDLFEQIVQKIKHAAGHINPARLGDSLALLVVMLHPFKDGNGRTARLVGLVFQNEYDTHLVDEFRVCSMSREKARQEGVRYLPLGYAPRMPHGADQSLPEDVSAYFDELLSGSDREGLYTGTYGQADLTDSRR